MFAFFHAVTVVMLFIITTVALWFGLFVLVAYLDPRRFLFGAYLTFSIINIWFPAVIGLIAAFIYLNWKN